MDIKYAISDTISMCPSAYPITHLQNVFQRSPSNNCIIVCPKQPVFPHPQLPGASSEINSGLFSCTDIVPITPSSSTVSSQPRLSRNACAYTTKFI